MSEARIIKKTPEMEEYEYETGKLAIWKGKESKEFRKWQVKKQKQLIKKQESETLSLSREERKQLKVDLKQKKEIGKDYEHLIVVENLHKTYLL